MAKHLQDAMKHLLKRLLTMGSMVEKAVQRSLVALEERRGDMLPKIVEGDHKIDRWEVGIEEECLKILALHQPVAKDLRSIAAVLKINNDLERMGDEAVNIAEHADYLAATDSIPVPPNLKVMAEAAMRMLQKSLEAFVNRDTKAARKICKEDDVVDQYNREVINALRKMMHEDPATIERATHLFSVSRHLERIADHATNIAEDVVYMVEGKIIRHRVEDYSRQSEPS